MEMIHSRSYTYIIKNVYSIHQRFLTRLSLTKRSWTVQRQSQSRMTTLSIPHKSGALVTCGQTTSEVLHLLPMKSKRSRGNFTGLLPTSISWKAFVSMSLLLVLLLSASSNSWKGRRRSFPSLPVTRTNILQSRKIS